MISLYACKFIGFAGAVFEKEFVAFNVMPCKVALNRGLVLIKAVQESGKNTCIFHRSQIITCVRRFQ